jgi:hypothetical protein
MEKYMDTEQIVTIAFDDINDWSAVYSNGE